MTANPNSVLRLRRIVTALPLFAALFTLSTMTARTDSVDDFLKRQIRKRHIPGLSLAIVKDGRVVKAAGYGLANVELGARATPQTVYCLASMSKQFAAASIMLLVQDGKVSLESPIGKYLDGAPDAWKGVTVRHLLTHTSGLPREGMQTTDKTGRADFSRDEIWKAAIALPLQAPPGEKFAYSNLGFNLAALIVERVSGKSYADFLQARIFGPLGMKSSRLNDYQTPVQNRACGYIWTQRGLRIADQASPTLYFGAGAILSTVLDLAKWDAALYTDKLLNAESRKQMWLATRLNGGRTSEYGFGWEVGSLHGHERVAHDGLLAGFRTYIARFLKDRLTLIVLTNMGSLPDPGTIANGVAREYFPDLTDYLTDAGTGRDTGGMLDPSPPRLKPEALAALTGRYEYSNNRMLTVETAKRRLLAHLPGSENDVFTPLSDSVFVCTEEATRLTFQKTPSGEVSEIEIQEYDSKRKIPRIGPLPHAIAPAADPDPARTANVLAILKALSQGGKAVSDNQGIADGARADFSSAEADLEALDSIVYLGERDLSDKKLTRHNGRVARVLYYQWKAEKISRYIQVYLTPNGQVTDEDVVEN